MKIGSYYWLCGNDDPHTEKTNWRIWEHDWKIEYELDEDIYTLTIKIIQNKLSAKYYKINAKPTKNKKRNQRRSYTHTNSMERVTTVVHTDTRVDIAPEQNKKYCMHCKKNGHARRMF